MNGVRRTNLKRRKVRSFWNGSKEWATGIETAQERWPVYIKPAPFSGALPPRMCFAYHQKMS
jgi:hypothetical protein